MDDTGPAARQYTRTCPVEPLRGRYWRGVGIFAQQVVSVRGSYGLAASGATSVSIGNLAAVPANGLGLHAKAAMRADGCPFSATGLLNFSVDALTPQNALTWQVNF